MELATTLTSQSFQNVVREVGINPNYWYPVGWANQLAPGEVMSAEIWQQEFALYRDLHGQLYALEDVCPHKGVALHKGIVQGNHLACKYHGWAFDGTGKCVDIPYLPSQQKLPCAQVRSYQVQEKYNLIWVFPGDQELAWQQSPPEMPEFDNTDWFMVPVSARMNAHFSICNENSMDVFHGFLHQNLQGWFDPVLKSLQATEASVCAQYDVSYKGRMAQFVGLSDRADQVTTRTVSVEYRYPHYYSSLEGISALYLMRLPVGLTASRSFALFFFKIRLPKWLKHLLTPVLQKLLQRFVFMKFLNQDIEMMESEQRTYLANPQRHYVEINPAIIAVQRLIVRQYKQFMQQSSQLSNHRPVDSQQIVNSNVTQQILKKNILL
ncbi:MAG: aromatic ring-hydroxylating dioxygenase subunit alpha [Symploca sp. SIO1C4]|uniref:Aromatic ring-hydroxylating dioxygenase subunit alpha n=1 Tax=Symploca sp. SIO1C4 TaxID=2607765 RepID=A0A6B3NK83_9CYAN|nr:aromatic ring-hydroxylating dioxygenase subunit alpha [Symploca sp. SIO1C4]